MPKNLKTQTVFRDFFLDLPFISMNESFFVRSLGLISTPFLPLLKPPLSLRPRYNDFKPAANWIASLSIGGENQGAA